MNERIKELIKQANLDDDMFPLDDGWENPELVTFAELIVQECVSVLHDIEPRSRHISHALKQHFGVEE